ncbi:MAG: PilZ domain-containing protein [Erythrobacter sp.]|uniref:PilZ domain-containing protein n=1 Tax=Erythrobacter sp. TaxID=1042 RepID=UPI00261876F5|nr:PilZ domain-containing protein [Erythrobacter sp.]MDJ0979323.1 PilZ domain-containing protein [Erythrobacter sp.]
MLVTTPKRKPRRIRLLIEGSLETPVGQIDVRVRDLSKRGALIEVRERTLCDVDVKLTLMGDSRKGRIVWRAGSRIGIRFNRSLSEQAWNELAGRQMRVGAPRNYRHDQIETEPKRLKVTPRSIRLGPTRN